MSRRGHDRRTSIDEWIERDRVAAEDGRRHAAANGRPYAVPTALDPDFTPPPFAAQTAAWNPREWLRSKRVDP